MSAYAVSTRGLAGRKVPQGVLTPINTLLFGASEPGAWYDPSDMSALFQDSAGTVPVTAVEQPVGGMLDLSGRGNHATQATTTKRPIYSRLVNLMVGSEQWNKLTGTDGSGLVTQEGSSLPAFLSATSVSRVTSNSGFGFAYQYQVSQPVVQGAINTKSFFFKPVANCVTVRAATSAADPYYFVYNLLTKVTTIGVNAGSLKVEEFPDGWLRFSVTQKTPAATAIDIFVILGGSTSTSDIVVFLTAGYDIRLAADAHLPYQRVNTASDYDADPSKFPAYLRFDGVDDSLSTSNIDFTSTDKMTVWAGVKQVPGTAAQYITAINRTGDQRFALIATLSRSTQFESRGTASGYAAVANSEGVLTGIGGIGGDVAIIRVNGVQAASSASDQGTGNYSNAPLYIGSGDSASLYLNARLYGLIVRGAQSTLSQIEATELYMKKKVGIA